MHPGYRLDELCVDVWVIELDVADTDLEALRAVLAPEELARAERFRRPLDRDRYVVARGRARGLLGRYLEIDPTDVPLATASHGKPILAGSDALPPLSFNVSHSDGLALVAVADGRDVGVDLERITSERDLPAISRVAFSPSELAQWRATAPPERAARFFTTWVRKEAYLKARGEGLATAPEEVDTCSWQEVAGRLLVDAGERDRASWSVQDVRPATGFAAAVAARDGDWRLRVW